MKKTVINLKIQTVHVEPRVIKTDFTWVVGEPIFDCADSAAEAMGITRDEYRRTMNSEKGYKKLLILEI